MFVKTCRTTTHFFSVESTFSALISGDGKTFETIYNFLKNKLDYKIKSGLKTHVINLGIKLKKTL